MSFQSIIQQTIGDLQTGTSYSLVQSLKRLNQISKLEYQANQTVVRDKGYRLGQAIKSNFTRNKQTLSPNMGVMNIMTQLTNKIPQTQLKFLLSQILKKLPQVFRQNIRQNQIQVAKQIVQNQVVQSNSQVSQQTVPNTVSIRPSIAMQTNPNEISLVPYRNILQSSVRYTTPQNAPATIKVLQKYVQMQGKIPNGTVTNKPGLAYVGLTRQIDFTGSQTVVPYKKNQIQKNQLPDIPMQIKYYANRTINSWNKYVQSQGHFVNFMNQISTQQKRNRYMQRQLKTMNTNTFSAQVLATLMYYYVKIPLQKLNKFDRAVNSQEQFLEKYQVGQKRQTNPFILDKKNAAQLVRFLLNTYVSSTDRSKFEALVNAYGIKQPYKNLKKGQFPTPTTLYAAIANFFSKETVSNVLNKKAIQKLKQHVQNRTLQSTAFFYSYGITDVKIKQFLSLQQYSVKQRRFSVNSQTNNKVLSMIQKISKQKKKDDQKKYWNYTWGSQNIACHDYIFINY